MWWLLFEGYLFHGVFAWDLLTCASWMRERAISEKYFFQVIFFHKTNQIQ
jgi:hypothetical protein